MCKILTALVGILALLALQAQACHRITPDQTALEEYESVFLGRVTGVHLVGYESSLAGEPDANVEGVAGISVSDGSAPVVVKAVPLGVYQGEPAKSVEVRLVGCTAPLPNLKELGLFFVHPDSDSAVTVWESDEELFTHWLDRLALDGDER